MKEIELFKSIQNLSLLNEKQIAKINERLPESKRVKSIIGHSGSQTGYTLQTMHMLSESPLSRMKQCQSQIDKKFDACKEVYFNIEKKKISLKKLNKRTDDMGKLLVVECESQIESLTISMNTSLRQIGMLQDMYDGIMKKNKIPKDWTEEDFEKQEIQSMIKRSFRLGIQNLQASSRVSMAAVEWWEQLGIHPQLAELRIRKYMYATQEIVNKTDVITIQLMYDFLDEMAKEFKDSYKLALKRIGLDEIGSKGFMSQGVTKPQ